MRRIGKFKIPRNMLEDPDTSVILAKMEFIPHHADMNGYEGEVIYTGISPMFDEVDIGAMIPMYIITCHKDDDNVINKVEAEVVVL